MLLSWKAQRGPLAGPETFKEKAVHLVSVLIDHRHIILPVQGLICPPNQHLLSTTAVMCWEGGGSLQLNHSKQVWVQDNFLLPFVMFSRRRCVFQNVSHCFMHWIEFRGPLWNGTGFFMNEHVFHKKNKKNEPYQDHIGMIRYDHKCKKTHHDTDIKSLSIWLWIHV